VFQVGVIGAIQIHRDTMYEAETESESFLLDGKSRGQEQRLTCFAVLQSVLDEDRYYSVSELEPKTGFSHPVILRTLRKMRAMGIAFSEPVPKTNRSVWKVKQDAGMIPGVMDIRPLAKCFGGYTYVQEKRDVV